MRESVQKGLMRVGLRIRQLRRQQELTLEDVARDADISRGLLSKIENFRVVPSLPVLLRVARALRIDAGELLKGTGPQNQDEGHVVIRAKERETIERDSSKGFMYESVTCQSLESITFDSFVLTLTPDAQRQPVTTEGEEFVYVLRGEVDFELGGRQIHLSENDAIFFDGRIPHVPRNAGKEEAQLLAVYLLKNEGS